jgi:hypothetical protein
MVGKGKGMGMDRGRGMSPAPVTVCCCLPAQTSELDARFSLMQSSIDNQAQALRNYVDSAITVSQSLHLRSVLTSFMLIS